MPTTLRWDIEKATVNLVDLLKVLDVMPYYISMRLIEDYAFRLSLGINKREK